MLCQHHLQRSNAEMAEADPDDPDLREAIEENEAILVRQHEKISQCELRLQQLGGDGEAADAAAPEPAPPVLAAEPEPEPEPEPGAAALDLSNLQLRPAPKMVASSDGAPLDLQAIIQAASTPGAAQQAPAMPQAEAQQQAGVPPPQAEAEGAASMTPRGDGGQAPAADAAGDDGLYL